MRLPLRQNCPKYCRGNLNFSASPRKAMPVGAFSPEVKTDTVNPAGTTMSSPWPGLNETNSSGQSGLTTVAADAAAGTRNSINANTAARVCAYGHCMAGFPPGPLLLGKGKVNLSMPG